MQIVSNIYWKIRKDGKAIDENDSLQTGLFNFVSYLPVNEKDFDEKVHFTWKLNWIDLPKITVDLPFCVDPARIEKISN